MLKRLAILTVLMLGCVCPTWPQVPGNGGKENRPAQKKADAGQVAQPSPTALHAQPAPAEQEESAKEQPSGYPWKELLAPANIPNWVLCFVGGIAGLAAVLTLRAIKRKSDLMKEQSDLIKTKERAWLSVELIPIKTLDFSWLEFDSILINIENFGGTHAFNVRAFAWARLSAYDTQPPLDPDKFEGIEIPDVIRTSGGAASGLISLEKKVSAVDISGDGVKWMAVAQGTVFYDDIFGTPHVTKFRRYSLIWELQKTKVDDTYDVINPNEWIKDEANPQNNQAT